MEKSRISCRSTLAVARRCLSQSSQFDIEMIVSGKRRGSLSLLAISSDPAEVVMSRHVKPKHPLMKSNSMPFVLNKRSIYTKKRKGFFSPLKNDLQPTSGERIAAIGGVGLVMGVTNTFRDKPGIQARACNTMGHLAASEELARVVAAAGGVQSSMAAMKEFPEDVAVQKNGCHALANMAVEESVATDVIAKGGLSLILSAMAKYADDSELQDSACRVLGSLAACDEVCRQVGQAGCIAAVMDAMKAHKESVGVQECGCWALVSLSEDYDNCYDLRQAGALDVALYAMEMFYTGEALQEYCCRMLANMAAADDFDVNLASEKVVEALLGAMERYTKNLEIQEHALFTLGKVILESDAVVQPVLKNDGVHLVSEALKAFHTNINVQRGGCRALGALAMHEDAKDEIIIGGGLDIILSVIKQEEMEENEVVLMICCNALASLVDTEDVKVKVKVCEEGGLSRIIHAIQTYPDDPELCECVCRAISSLAGCNEVIENVRAAGAFQQVLVAMEKHPDNPEVQESAVHALRYAVCFIL
ncbi:uncharacterized protein LOC134177144 isoform X2 [Corticium candelabrum]|uniref:uncharacterized protein LOC134177144 isoform X2 n=1 Tax=Corticium candelabrum TaxID=121492 RepID=UPI002E26EE68|nr:uncharacterized protein LOC134177144 isoform X2 [Corticium candelabrum]